MFDENSLPLSPFALPDSYTASESALVSAYIESPEGILYFYPTRGGKTHSNTRYILHSLVNGNEEKMRGSLGQIQNKIVSLLPSL